MKRTGLVPREPSPEMSAKFQRLLFTACVSAFAFAHRNGEVVVLFEDLCDATTDAQLADAARRKFTFAGVLGLLPSGQVRGEFMPGVTEDCARLATDNFSSAILTRLLCGEEAQRGRA